MASGWRSEAARLICYGVGIFLGCGCGLFPQLYAGVGADLACCAIVRDQLRQTTRRLEQLVTSSVASQTEPAFDFRATMAELHRLTQHSAQCERASGSIMLLAGYAYALCGPLYVYGAATSDPGAVVLSGIFLVFACLFFAQAIDLLLGPLSVTAGASRKNSVRCTRCSLLGAHRRVAL